MSTTLSLSLSLSLSLYPLFSLPPRTVIAFSVDVKAVATFVSEDPPPPSNCIAIRANLVAGLEDVPLVWIFHRSPSTHSRRRSLSLSLSLSFL